MNSAIQDRMESRRRLAAEQAKADEVSAEIYDTMARHRKELGVSSDIARMAVGQQPEDPKSMYEYIIRLERLQNSVWCTNCNTVKNAPGHVQAAQQSTADKSEIKHAMASLAVLKLNLEDQYKEMQESVAVFEAKFKRFLGADEKPSHAPVQDGDKKYQLEYENFFGGNHDDPSSDDLLM